MPANMGECVCIAVTERALLFETPDEGKIWVPKSILADDGGDCFNEDTEQHDSGELVVMTWWAKKQGYA